MSFAFKQFSVSDERCAMRVSTDGVLLGAWAGEDISPRRILDVGTGCGLIALMLAQRMTEAVIDAIDIDADACAQAEANVAASPFADRVAVARRSFFDHNDGGYDLIVCNPPFFRKSLKSTDAKRNVARHSDAALPLKDFIHQAAALLAPQGRIALILPTERKEELHIIISGCQLFVARLTEVSSVEDRPPFRFMAEITQHPPLQYVNNHLFIETSSHSRSAEYAALISDFFL